MIGTVRFVNFPKPGGKYGSLKLSDNSNLMCPPDLLPHFRAGMYCDIPTKAQTWGQGTDQERQVQVVAGPPQPAQNGSYSAPAQQGYNRPVPRETPPYGARSPGERPSYGYGRPPADERMIFVTGVVGRAMGSGKFTASEIPVLAMAAAAAFAQLLGGPRAVPSQPAGAGGVPPEAQHQTMAPGYEQGDPGPSDYPPGA